MSKTLGGFVTIIKHYPIIYSQYYTILYVVMDAPKNCVCVCEYMYRRKKGNGFEEEWNGLR